MLCYGWDVGENVNIIFVFFGYLFVFLKEFFCVLFRGMIFLFLDCLREYVDMMVWEMVLFF